MMVVVVVVVARAPGRGVFRVDPGHPRFWRSGKCVVGTSRNKTPTMA